MVKMMLMINGIGDSDGNSLNGDGGLVKVIVMV